MGRIQDDVENAHQIDGGTAAFATVSSFLQKLRKSAENEGSVDVVLSQTSSAKGHKKKDNDAVESFPFDMQTDIDDLANEIVDRAIDDCEGLHAKTMKYDVRADGLEARCGFTLKGDDGEEEDMDDVEDLPNRKGLLALLMRHAQGSHKLVVGTSHDMITSLREENRELRTMLLQQQKQAMESIKAYEELVSGRHMRDMEMKKMENKDRRMDQLAGTVLQGFPLLVTKFLGGGAGAAAMQAVPGSRTPMEGLLEGFLRTLDNEQFQQILSSGLFRPDQITALVELVKFAMERDEAEKKAAAEKTNASTNGAPQANPEPQAPAAHP